MRVYNAEFFRPDYSFITSRNFSEFEYSFDYVSPDTNSFVVEALDVRAGDFVQILGGIRPIYGIVDHVDEGQEDKSLSEVFFHQMTALFNVPILFDTDLQPSAGGTKTIEQIIADFITSIYGTSPDALQNIGGLTVRTTSATPDWGLNLKSTYEGMHHLIVNFWESVISRALKKYGVVVDVLPNFADRTMTVTVGKNADAVRVIEADLPNILEKSIIIGRTESSTNKATIYNGQNYAESLTYYLHNNGTYDTDDTDRITPVIFDVMDVDMTDSERTFAQEAKSVAAEVFGGSSINNNITLTMLNEDDLVRPHDLKIGQTVEVISEGVSYNSVVTGFTVGEVTEIVCGTVRTELTKII